MSQIPTVTPARFEAAEEVCWAILLAMEFGYLPRPDDPIAVRLIADPMKAWARIAFGDHP